MQKYFKNNSFETIHSLKSKSADYRRRIYKQLSPIDKIHYFLVIYTPFF